MIPMKLNDEQLQQVTVVTPAGADFNALLDANNKAAFNAEVVDFSAALSTKLLRDVRTQALPEVVAMAYWLRKANVRRIKDEFNITSGQLLRLPRGVAFHIAPSNVDTIFIYSLFLSMFSGNRNIVRLSSTPNVQVESICSVLDETLSDFPSLCDQLRIVRYEHSDEITAALSALCDVRVIWGGDETISRIRAFPLPPRSKELTFADRFSLAVVDAVAYDSASEKEQQAVVKNFYNDCYWFGQMACSSPRLVCWLSCEQAPQASARFWQRLESYTQEQQPDVAHATMMDKYLTQCLYAIDSEEVSIPKTSTNFVSRVAFKGSLPTREIHCGGGLFLETQLQQLDQLATFIINKDQTIASFGVSAQDYQEFLSSSLPSGIDRVVPFGEALAFSPVWDGYDLLQELSRGVSISI